MRRVLVVIDMQNDFIDGTLGTKEAQAIVSKVVDKINSFDGDIYATVDMHNDGYLNTQEGKLLPVKHCLYGTDGYKINKEMQESIIDKLKEVCIKDTFGSIGLADSLLELHDTVENITEIELIGVCTDICVISNALIIKAFLPEATITVDANCCAGVTPESHTRALEAMKMCQINVINE